MSDSSFQSEIPKARINLKLDLHTGGAGKKTELPLKLLVAGDFSNGQASAPLSERKKINLNKNNFDAVLSEYSPKVNLTLHAAGGITFLGRLCMRSGNLGGWSFMSPDALSLPVQHFDESTFFNLILALLP